MYLGGGGIWLEPGGSGAKGLGGTQEEVGHFTDGILCSPQLWTSVPTQSAPWLGPCVEEGQETWMYSWDLGAAWLFGKQ